MTDAVPPPLPLNVRDYRRGDARSIQTIEEQSYFTPWQPKIFNDILKQKHTFCIVASHPKRLLGFMVARAHADAVELLNIAVHPDYRRRAVGKRMLGWLCDRLSASETPVTVHAELRETNLASQLFLKGCGFWAVDVQRGHFADTGEDAFRFERIVGEAAAKKQPG